MEPPHEYGEITDGIRKCLDPWRKITIAVDGADGAGKSTLARYLAWQLGAPLIETDLMINSNNTPIKYDLETIKKLILSRHSQNRPVILEGIKILETLKLIDVEPDVLVFVENENDPGKHRFKEELKGYFDNYQPKLTANYTYTWKGE